MTKWTASLALAAVAALGWPQAAMPIYTDSLQQGWQNWSWATVNLSNASPVHSGTRSIAATMGGWQALSLNRGAVDTSVYKSVRFWAHGGSNGGQRLMVKAVVGGEAQAQSFSVGPLVKSAWTQYEVPLSAIGASDTRSLTGFWFQSAVSSSQPTCYFDDIELLPATPASTATLSVDAAHVLQPVDDRMFGVNTAVWDGELNTAATIGLMGAMGSRILRFPGGSISDTFHWQTNRSDGNNWAWATDFDDFANVMLQTGQQATVTVNYGSGTPSEAAAWVHYANVVRKLGIRYWDVGNENYGTWENDINTRPNDPATYATRFQLYWQAMKAVDPSIKIGVPVVTGEDSYANYSDNTVVNPRTGKPHNGWTPVVLTRIKALGIIPDYVVYHRYEFGSGEENDDILLQRSRTWSADIADLRQQLSDYLGLSCHLVEIQMNENNSCYANQGKQSTSVVNAMYYLDSLASVLRTEVRSFVWWDWRNGVDTAGNNGSYLYGWRNYGDLGMGRNATDQYPTYYAAKLMRHFARGGDATVQATSDNPFVAAYGARGRDGSLRVLLVGKRLTGNQSGTIRLQNYSPASSYTVYRYGQAQDNNAKNNSGSVDVAASTLTGATADLATSVAPYTGMVYVFTSLRKVAGRLVLQDWTGSLPTSASFEFRQPGTGSVSWEVVAPVATDGAFILNGPPVDGSYELACKVWHWLGASVPVDTSGGSVEGVVLSLPNGDIDGDNVVTVFDYAVLSDYFDRSSSDEGWSEVGSNGFRPIDADLDGDGTVTVFDYAILSGNFDREGA